MANPWLRSDLRASGLGVALVIPEPRHALTWWASTGGYCLTGPTAVTTLVPSTRLADNLVGVPVPSDDDLAWLRSGGTS